MEQRRCGVVHLFRLRLIPLVATLGWIACLGGNAHLSLASEGQPFLIQLESIREKYQLPAIAAAAMQRGELREIAATGVRRIGHSKPVTIEDSWHIGSCAKSMTATLAAILVERGQIKWETRIEEVFPEARDSIHPAWLPVTLDQLLSHRAGAPAKAPEDLRHELPGKQGDATEERRALAKQLMQRPPEFLPGRIFSYSDDGYAIAGAMLERQSRRPWEKLIVEELCAPLGMTSVGFGAPGEGSTADQPWGHEAVNKSLRPVPPGPGADNPPVIGPAGTLHCSITDLVRYAAWHARAGRAPGPVLLTPKSFEMLHGPTRQNYALGWSVLDQEWAGGRALMHPGSNAYWNAVIWIAPERDTAFVVATNCYSPEAEQACDEVITLLVERVLGVRR